MLIGIFIVLAYWHNSSQVTTQESDTSWYEPSTSSSFLLFLKAACLVGKTSTNFIVFGLSKQGIQPTIYLQLKPVMAVC